MRALKWIAVAAVWGAAIAAIVPAAVKPLRCNDVELDVERRTDALEQSARSPVYVSSTAREHLERLRDCLSSSVNCRMLAARNARLLHDYPAAVSYYRDAMRYDRRPEIYLGLGLAEVEAGEHQAGVRDLVTACIYNPEMISEVQQHHGEVQQAVWNYQLFIEGLKHKKGR
jgi:tetratricopeptide (TPR) repeat protein